MTKRLWSAVFALTLLAAPAAQQLPFDILIVNARVLDGSGNPWIRADVAIRGDRIVAMGKLAGAPAALVIDAKDRYVTPGFMDVHSHASGALAGKATRRLLWEGYRLLEVTGRTGKAGGYNADAD